MDADSFRALVRRLEERAAARPGWYKARVAGLAALGYAYVLGVLGLLAALTVFLVLALRGLSFKLVVALLVAIAAVLRALWIRMPPPEGFALSPGAAPELFELTRALGRRLRAPRVHAIHATPDLNAAIVQSPRLGVFGWHKNYLLVGLPLLQSLSPEEWQAVLAHELGHLSGNHGRFGSWIYRVRATWGRLHETLESGESAVAGLLFGKFLEWYAPYFAAYTFVLARAHEYEADAASAELVGHETARRALLRIEVASRVEQEYWRRIANDVAAQPAPPANAFARQHTALRTASEAADAGEWLAQAWRRPTDEGDTHPALAARLTALGWPADAGTPPPPEPLVGPSAANAYLGEAETAIVDQLDESWARASAEPWKQQHDRLVKMRARLAELDGRPGEMSPHDEWERVQLCDELGDETRATTLATDLAARMPDHAPARFYVGRALLRRGDPAGVSHLEASMRLEPQAIMACCHALYEFFWARGDPETARRYGEMAAQRADLVARAQAERATLTPSTPLEPHDLDAAQIATLKSQLETLPLVREAFLLRRPVTLLPEQPSYVLAITPHGRTFGRNDEGYAHLQTEIPRVVEIDVPLQLVLLVKDLKPLRRKLLAMPGARVI